MFKNTLTGLSKREKEVFDEVCVHLNGCMRRMGLKQLDGEEDQILLDLWMDTFPYKVDEDGKVIEREVGGKMVKELDFSRSLIEQTSVGIYKWRAEQLFINKCKYLFGDRRTRKMVEGKPMTETVTDAWGNERKRAVYEEEIDQSKASKRDLTMKVNESELARDGEDPITIADVAGVTEGGYEESMLMYDLSRMCDEVEMVVVRKFMDGDSANRIYKDFDESGVKFTARQMQKLKDKLRGYFLPFMTRT